MLRRRAGWVARRLDQHAEPRFASSRDANCNVTGVTARGGPARYGVFIELEPLMTATLATKFTTLALAAAFVLPAAVAAMSQAALIFA